MTVVADPRLHPDRLLKIAMPDGSNAYVGPLQDSLASELNRSTKALAAAIGSFSTTVAEARATNGMMASHREKIIGEAGARLGRALAEASKVYTAERERITREDQTATAVEPHGATPTPPSVLFSDLALAQRLATMPTAERTKTMHAMTVEPGSHSRMADAILRLDPEVSGIDRTEHDALRRAVLKARDPARAAAIEAQVLHARHTRDALQIATKVLRANAPGAFAEAAQSSPEIVAAAN